MSFVLASNAAAFANYAGWLTPDVTWYLQGADPTHFYSTSLCYDAHVSMIGWQGWKCDGEMAGDGRHQIEAIAFAAGGPALGVQAHLANVGWTVVVYPSVDSAYEDWVGTTGYGRALEAFAIERADGGPMCGQADVAGIGWQSWQHSNPRGIGQNHDVMVLGTTGQARPMIGFRLEQDC